MTIVNIQNQCVMPVLHIKTIKADK